MFCCSGQLRRRLATTGPPCYGSYGACASSSAKPGQYTNVCGALFPANVRFAECTNTNSVCAGGGFNCPVSAVSIPDAKGGEIEFGICFATQAACEQGGGTRVSSCTVGKCVLDSPICSGRAGALLGYAWGCPEALPSPRPPRPPPPPARPPPPRSPPYPSIPPAPNPEPPLNAGAATPTIIIVFAVVFSVVICSVWGGTKGAHLSRTVVGVAPGQDVEGGAASAWAQHERAAADNKDDRVAAAFAANYIVPTVGPLWGTLDGLFGGPGRSSLFFDVLGLASWGYSRTVLIQLLAGQAGVALDNIRASEDLLSYYRNHQSGTFYEGALINTYSDAEVDAVIAAEEAFLVRYRNAMGAIFALLVIGVFGELTVLIASAIRDVYVPGCQYKSLYALRGAVRLWLSGGPEGGINNLSVLNREPPAAGFEFAHIFTMCVNGFFILTTFPFSLAMYGYLNFVLKSVVVLPLVTGKAQVAKIVAGCARSLPSLMFLFQLPCEYPLHDVVPPFRFVAWVKSHHNKRHACMSRQ